jgi:hypothetical protein
VGKKNSIIAIDGNTELFIILLWKLQNCPSLSGYKGVEFIIMMKKGI